MREKGVRRKKRGQVGDDRIGDDNGCYINNKFYLVSLILVVKQHRSELVSGFSGLRKTHLIVYVPCRTKNRI